MSRFATSSHLENDRASAAASNEFGRKIAVITMGEKTNLKQKLVRKRRSAGNELARHQAIWMPPLLAETGLLVTAWLLGQTLLGVMNGGPGFYGWLTGLATVATLLLIVHTRLNDLFMPRAIIVRGVGLLLLGALAMTATMLLTTSFGDRKMLVATLPLGLFLLRSVMVLSTARYAPSTREMSSRSSQGTTGLLQRLSDKKKYWTS